MNPAITLSVVRSWNTAEIVDLYRAGGWWDIGYDPNQIPRLLDGSFLAIVAMDEQGNAIGFGRVISDGAADGYLQDIVVFSEYRNQGIGSRIVAALKKLAILYGHTWIGLVAVPGKEEFYRRAGFSTMVNYTPMLKDE